ncbi:hypothetical protein H8J86_07820 [Clostridium perfringens]|uniref:hypothetical protein n=1 Tax=Clostridium perfringens TaxID=1502 RepID=UPI0018E44CD9|nr:hypothetical protein [Clostridium perfringens]MBI6005858.1 hypothetical protein [Clostridium perfringens]
MKAENKAYKQLIEYGFVPQGSTKDFKQVVVLKIENENTNNEKREVYHFENWQEAVKTLIDELPVIKSNISTYDTIKDLDNTSGVFIGEYVYILDGELIKGYCDKLDFNNEFIPICKVECNDGFLYATNYKNIVGEKYN